MVKESSGKLLDLGEGISFEITAERVNKLASRREYEGIVHHPGKGTPAIPDFRVKFSEKIGVDPSRVYVRYLKTTYGIGMSRTRIHVYDTAEAARQFEPKYIIDRNKTLEEEIAEAE